MHAVQFNKTFGQNVLDAIKNGTAIPAPAEGWTGNHMLMLAGMMYAAVFSQGPYKQQILGLSAEKLESMHPEHREAINETLERVIHDGIELVSTFAFRLIDGRYDAECEPELQAVVYQEAKGGKAMVPVKGFKRYN